MSATVYQRVCLKRNNFSRKDLRKIANWINSIYRKDHEEDPPKVEQQEGELTFMVFNYPDEIIPMMDMIVDKFFKNKSFRAEKHELYLLDSASGSHSALFNKKQPNSKHAPKAEKKFNKSAKAPTKPGNYNANAGNFNAKSTNFKPKPKNDNFNFQKSGSKPGILDSYVKQVKTEAKGDSTTIKNEIPVATTLRKRKTVAVEVNNGNK